MPNTTAPASPTTYVVTARWNGNLNEYRITDEVNANGMYDYLKERGFDEVTLWTTWAYDRWVE